MLSAIIILSAISAILIWNYVIENPPVPNIAIPESHNIEYGINDYATITPSDIVGEIDKHKGKPVMLYFYATWCSVCKGYLPTINEMSRKFQNTDLAVISVAIDRNINHQILVNYLTYYGKIYFKPNYLLYQDGLEDLLKSKNIKFGKVIPFTVLIDRDGNVVKSFTGPKSENFLNRQIIKMIANKK